MISVTRSPFQTRLPSAQAGLTLIELIIYIVVVLVGLAGVLTVFNTTVRGSADPVVRKHVIYKETKLK